MPFPFLNSAKKTDAAPVKKKPVDDGPIINPEADKILGRMTVQTFVFTMTALILLTVVMPFFNQPPTAHHPASTVWKYHQIIDFGSAALIIAVLYTMNGRLFATRLSIGRDLVAKREFRQAAVCLQPFEAFGQRWLDRSGEAHYLLAQAYAGSNNKVKAEECKTFVIKHRPGPWAAKLGGNPGKVDPSTLPARPKPTKGKPRRRF